MRPTFSIIAFTTLSGMGYGLLFLVGLALAGGTPTTATVAVAADMPAVILLPSRSLLVALAVGCAFCGTGLLASLGHLGRPERAWRALSQWRTSWLSREGIAALASFVPIAAIAVVLIVQADARIALRLLGLILSACCLCTVFCTARIYSSLPPIRAWHNRYTLPAYLLLGLYGGALWHLAVHAATLDDGGLFVWATIYHCANALLIAPAAALLKRAYWRDLDAQLPVDVGTATGLVRLGRVRSFEQPHTEENYLTHEMGFVFGRVHSRKLRAVAFWLILLVPIATVPLAWLIGWPAPFLAAMLGSFGIFVERWLFFAEARHAVMAYYGR